MGSRLMRARRAPWTDGRHRALASRRPGARGGRAPRVPGPWASVALYAASLAVLLISHLGHGWGFVDLHVYERAGAAVRGGERLYALRFPGALAFTYPPFAALLLAPLTLPA